MKKITVTLTEEQEKFLKTFAEKQKAGADDNLFTANALHVVENKVYDLIPYSDEIAHYFEDIPLTFTTDEDYENWFDDETSLIKDWYEFHDTDCPIEIKPYQEVDCCYLIGVDNKKRFITNREQYFMSYGIEIKGIAWKKYHWEKVAYFFIREEAKKYLEYQKHNLREPRIYTYSAGYGNEGDFIPFRNLLMEIGTELNKEELAMEKEK